jgi:dipeptidyl aminopeptidase/acylaminoacyl peptidase
VYSASGHVLYQQVPDGPVVALPFDAARLEPSGRPFQVIPSIGSRVGFQTRLYDVARDGTFIFVPAQVTANTGALVWVDPSGSTEEIVRVDHPVDLPRIAHDGTRIAFRTPAPSCDIWVYDLARGATMRLTSEGDNHGIVWSADDERIATFRLEGTKARPVWVRSDGAGQSVEAFPEDLSISTHVAALSPSGTGLVAVEQREGSSHDVVMLDLSKSEARPLLSSRFDEQGAALSPDGRLLVYVSNESGRNEVYVQSFPAMDARAQVSTEGGHEPVWSRDGRTIYFRNGNALLSASVEAGPRPVVGRPKALFEGTYADGAGGLAGFDVSADGRRFVMVLRESLDRTQEGLEVIVNFFTQLERLQSGGGDE